jgi:hypothetical protein
VPVNEPAVAHFFQVTALLLLLVLVLVPVLLGLAQRRPLVFV